MRNMHGKRIAFALACVLILSTFCGCSSSQAMADAIAADIDAFIAMQEDTPAPIVSEDSSAPPVAPYFDTYEDDFHPGVDFLELSYERPDLDELEAEIAAFYTVAETGDAAAVIAQCDKVEALWDHALTQWRLADIYYNKDLSDEFYETEQTELYAEITRIEVDLFDAYAFLIENGYRDALVEEWGETEVQYTLDYANQTDEVTAKLDARDNELEQEYLNVIDTFTVHIDGRDWTWDDIAQDENVVGDTYQRYIDIYYDAVAVELEDVFMEMVSVRNERARHLGYESYAHYSATYYDRDYSLEDVRAFREAVKQYIVPLYYDLLIRSYGYDDKEVLYDYSVDLDEMMDWMREGLWDLDPDLVQAFDYMIEFNYYDLEDGENKYPGAYTAYMSEYESPFYFGCFTGDTYAIGELVHEFGHYASDFHNPVDSSIDLAEIDSQGLELLMIEHYGEIYGEELAGDAAADVLLNMMESIISGCLYDELQEGIYTENLSMEEIGALHAQLYKDYGLADLYYYSDHSWIAVHHNFDAPYYYISYATSVVPALQIWQVTQDDRDAGVELYMSLHEREDYEEFRDVLAQRGLEDPLAPSTIQSLAGSLEEGVNRYLSAPWQEALPDAA